MLELTDIIGIIAFAISGFIIGVRHKLDLLGITISSYLTALGGGILRDVLINKIPFILRENFYGSVSIFVSILIFLFGKSFENIVMVLILGVIIRIVAYKKNWKLPVF